MLYRGHWRLDLGGGYDSNIILDRCSKCNGIRLDPGELIKVVRHCRYDPEMRSNARTLLPRYEQTKDDPWRTEVLYWILRILNFEIIRL